MMRNLRGHISVRRWRINRQSIGLLNKLPDGNNRAQTEKRVNDSFHDATALLFRADQQRVCRFIFVVHDNMRPSFFMMKTPPTSHFVYMAVIVHRYPSTILCSEQMEWIQFKTTLLRGC